MRPSIESKVDELINDMMKQGAPVDLAEHFSLPIAFKVIYELLGIPFEVGERSASKLFLHERVHVHDSPHCHSGT
jgi:cytochrome P450